MSDNAAAGPMDRVRQEFATFVEELRRERVATELRGCSADEVQKLEQALRCTLPLAYRLYLETMGHSAGRLFTHDHLAVTYEHLLTLPEELEDAMTDSFESSSSRFHLPERACVICGRLGEQFYFIRCDHPEDTPVFHVNTSSQKPERAYPSVLAWLRDQKAQAVEAIQAGYFDKYPNGTTP